MLELILHACQLTQINAENLALH